MPCSLRSLLFKCLGSPLCLLLFSLLTAASAARAQGAIEAWVQRYNGETNGNDFAAGMVVDASGNVYVTGGSSGSRGFGIDTDYVTLAYSSAGVPLWTNRWDGPGGSYDVATGLAIDANGNIYVTGSTSIAGGNADFLTVKYSNAGMPLWTNRYDSGSDEYPSYGGVAVDAGGNVFVTGTSYSGNNRDFLTVKLSSVGALLWAERFNGPRNGEDAPYDLAVDASGDVFVTGSSDGINTGEDYVTIKYSSAGVPLWTNTYDGGYVGPYGAGIDRAKALAVDAAGNVLVTGGSAGVADYVTIKYSGTGVPLWTNYYAAPGSGGDGAQAVAVDASGDVYVTGGSGSADGYGDYATVKYSSSGVPLWTNRYNGPGNSGDYAKALALDHGGNVVVTGFSAGSGTGENYATIAYSSAGVALWTIRYHGPLQNGTDWARAVGLDANGNVYVTGQSRDTDFYDNITTVKYVIPPIITRQPVSCTNAVGTTASFSVEVAGSAPFSYQWRKNGADLGNGGNVSGTATTNLTLANVQLANALGYSVVVANAYGSATSIVAQLTVVNPPNPGRFTNFKYSAETGFSLIFRDGTVGQHYRIQRSPSIAEGSWADWQNFTYTEPIGLTDVGATGAERRFYRAVTP